MKVEISVPEVVNIFKEIQRQRENIFYTFLNRHIYIIFTPPLTPGPKSLLSNE